MIVWKERGLILTKSCSNVQIIWLMCAIIYSEIIPKRDKYSFLISYQGTITAIIIIEFDRNEFYNFLYIFPKKKKTISDDF